MDEKTGHAENSIRLELPKTINNLQLNIRHMIDDINFTSCSMAETAQIMDLIKKTYESVKEITNMLDKEFDGIRFGCLVDKMDDNEVTSIIIKDLGRVTLASTISTSTKDAPPGAVIEWLLSIGRGDMVKENVESSSLKALIIELMKKGEVIPDFIKVTPSRSATITKK